MLFDEMTCFNAYRQTPAALAEDEEQEGLDSESLEPGGGEDQRGETDRRAANQRAAAARIRARQAKARTDQDRQELEELRAWKTSVAPKLDKVDKILSALEDKGVQTEDLDLLDPEDRKKFETKLASTATQIVRETLEQQREQEREAQRTERAQERFRESAPERQRLTRQAESEFLETRGVVIENPEDPSSPATERKEANDWTLSKWNRLIDFMQANPTRYAPSGSNGSYTVNDYERAEYDFDRAGVIKRVRSQTETELLDNLSPRNRNGRGARAPSAPETPKIDLSNLGDANPFANTQEAHDWIYAPDRKKSEVVRMKAHLRAHHRDFMKDWEDDEAELAIRASRGPGWASE